MAPNPISDNIGVAVSEIVQQAQRLGIVWSLRLATVTGNDTMIQSNSSVRVVLDGDDERITASSMIGQLAGGTRVYVLFVPPAGSYIIGRADPGNSTLPYILPALQVSGDAHIEGDLTTTGPAEFGNRAHGSVSVNGGGGVIVTEAISFPTLTGTGTMRCFATANSGSANVKNVAVSGVTNSGFNVNLLRDGANVNTTCYWLGIRSAT